MLSLLLALADPSAADEAAFQADLRCVAVTTYAVGQSPADKKAAMSGAVFYFLGKLDGRRPGVDLTKAMLALAADTSFRAIFPDEVYRCTDEAQTLAPRLKAMSEALIALPGAQ